MIDHAVPAQEMPATTPASRDGWRSAVPALRVDEVCGCGQCPSISLIADHSPASCGEGGQTVVTAFLDDALVILFVDGGVPSHLELAPLDDATVYREFPDASALEF